MVMEGQKVAMVAMCRVAHDLLAAYFVFPAAAAAPTDVIVENNPPSQPSTATSVYLPV